MISASNPVISTRNRMYPTFSKKHFEYCPRVRIAFRHVLTRHGTRVTIATSTSEALDKVKRQDFHAIVSDIARDDSKDPSGVEFLPKLRALGGPLVDIPVIFYVLRKDSGQIPSAFAVETMPDKLLLALSAALMTYRKHD